MKQKNETEALNDSILILQNKRVHELELIKEQFRATYEVLKPSSLIKGALKEVTSTPGLKYNMINDIIGLTLGYISKKVLVGTTRNPFKKVFGTFMQFAIANIVSRHSDAIRSTGEGLVRRLLKSRRSSKTEFHSIHNS